jgi:hypothetical protein
LYKRLKESLYRLFWFSSFLIVFCKMEPCEFACKCEEIVFNLSYKAETISQVNALLHDEIVLKDEELAKASEKISFLNLEVASLNAKLRALECVPKLPTGRIPEPPTRPVPKPPTRRVPEPPSQQAPSQQAPWQQSLAALQAKQEALYQKCLQTRQATQRFHEQNVESSTFVREPTEPPTPPSMRSSSAASDSQASASSSPPTRRVPEPPTPPPMRSSSAASDSQASASSSPLEFEFELDHFKFELRKAKLAEAEALRRAASVPSWAAKASHEKATAVVSLCKLRIEASRLHIPRRGRALLANRLKKLAGEASSRSSKLIVKDIERLLDGYCK